MSQAEQGIQIQGGKDPYNALFLHFLQKSPITGGSFAERDLYVNSSKRLHRQHDANLPTHRNVLQSGEDP